MEGNIYHNEGFGQDCLVDLDLDLQHALLEDYNLPAGDFYFSSDEELRLKSALFDEDEGFNEDYDDEMLQATTANAAALLDSQECNNKYIHDECDAGVELFDPINTTTTTGTSAFSQVESRDECVSHDNCMPGSSIDNCYENNIWSDNVPMELISARDLSREHSPLLQPMMHSQDIYNEQSVIISHKQPTNLPNKEELIDMPFYKFKRLLDNPSLSADDKLKAKTTRKKGKNKSAARQCRQRKMAMLEGLEEEVASLQQQQSSLARQKAQLLAETKFWERKCANFQLV